MDSPSSPVVGSDLEKTKFITRSHATTFQKIWATCGDYIAEIFAEMPGDDAQL